MSGSINNLEDSLGLEGTPIVNLQNELKFSKYNLRETFRDSEIYFSDDSKLFEVDRRMDF